MDSLFTSTPVQETIDYINRQIYKRKNFSKYAMKQFSENYCSKSLLSALFSWNRNYTSKQRVIPWEVHITNTGWYLYVLNKNWHASTTETSFLQTIHRCINIHCKKNSIDQLYYELNKYHPNINLTLKTNRKKFHDTQIITKKGKIEIAIYRKSTKLPV